MTSFRKQLRALKHFDAGDLLEPIRLLIQQKESALQFDRAARIVSGLESMLGVDVEALAQMRKRLDGDGGFRSRRLSFVREQQPWKAGFWHFCRAIETEDAGELRRWRWIAYSYGCRVHHFIRAEEMRLRAAAVQEALPRANTLQDPLIVGIFPGQQEKAEKSLFSQNALTGAQRAAHLAELDRSYAAWKKALHAESDRVERELRREEGPETVLEATRNQSTLASKVASLRQKLDASRRVKASARALEAERQLASALATAFGLTEESPLLSAFFLQQEGR